MYKDGELIRLKKYSELFFTILLFLLILPLFYPASLVTGQNDILEASNEAVVNAFNTLLVAEKEGADVTILVSRLNDASALLSEAENSLRNGDDITANEQASAALTIARQVTATAQSAKDQAISTTNTVFWSTLGLTIISLFILVFIMVFIWRLIKRRYNRTKLNERQSEQL